MKNGQTLKKGEVHFRPKLAKTLEILSEEGPDAFYNGSLGQSIVDEIQGMGGIITMEDLQSYR